MSENIAKLRQERAIHAAETAKLELRIKIAERQEDIQRMMSHMALQDAEIAKAREALAAMEA